MNTAMQHLEPAERDRSRVGDVVGTARPLRRTPPAIAAVGDGYLLVYRMPSLDGATRIATAMVFVPRTAAPSDGRKLVAYCHGTIGWAAQWAPSICVEYASHPKYRSHWEYALPIADLLAEGYVVVAPDYEGLGDTTLGVPKTGHLYYNSLSEGRSVNFAALASKRLLGDRLSGVWAAVGHSQGGRVVLSAAENIAELQAHERSLDFRGGVPISPSTNTVAKMNERWQAVLDAQAAGNPDTAVFYLGVLSVYSILYVRSMHSAGYAIDPAMMFGERALRFYYECAHLAFWPLMNDITEDAVRYVYCDVTDPSRVYNEPATYPGVRIDAINSPAFKNMMEANEIGRVRVPGDYLIVQGTTDSYTPESWCRELVNGMLTNGTRVRYSVHTGADHYGVLQRPAARAVTREHLRQIFA